MRKDFGNFKIYNLDNINALNPDNTFKEMGVIEYLFELLNNE